MSPAEQPFLDAVLAHPAADGPRLVYADFLAESDDPADAARADLIRLQLALARLPDDHPRRLALIEHQTNLLTRHQAAWTTHLRGLVVGVEFRRGLPDSVAVDAAVFAARGDELFARTRTAAGRSYLRRVHLREPARVLSRLLGCAALGLVEELSLAGGGLGNGGVNLLVRSPHLRALRALDLSFNDLDDAGVRYMAGSDSLPHLERLALNDNGHVTWDGAAALAASPYLAGLTDLDLGGNDVNDAGVRALAASPSLPRLAGLRLEHNPIGDGGVAALVGSLLFRRMLARDGRIDLYRNCVGRPGVEALARSADLARATALDLDRNYLDDAAVAALAASPATAGLTRLRLSRNQITDAGAFALSAAITDGLPALRTIDVSGNRLTRRGASAVRDAAVARGVIPDVSGNTGDGSGVVPALFADLLSAMVSDQTPDAGNVDELRRRVSFPSRRER